eukprot:TRINITY_DN3317_c1_g6_i1.p1 TRINITY_DN3317_c1_g6~~TRINITY_DN3317_c1_g6_i1.p1  ORF type:complete len:357 (-),score=125.95 TRINITY_DN3317_c1_g6_i1:85-1155(-)
MVELQSKKEFEEIFTTIAEEVISELVPNFEMPESAVNWCKELVNGTVTGGKMNRGLSVVHSVQIIKGNEVTEDLIKEAAILGWCIEWLQAYFLVADDVMDKSKTRRGLPCWYLRTKPLEGADDETVDLIACNDSLILEGMIYRILKIYFRQKPYYADLLDLFHEVTYQTELGQLLDLTSQPSSKKNNLDLFTIETYKKIVKYKTAFYSFYLPIALSLIVCDLYTEENIETSKSILLPMGEYFQIQDDFLDCYGTYEQIGKIGRDIEENKCGWLVVQALKLCNQEQREIISNHYGSENAEDVAIIKKLYKDLDLETIFSDYEEESYQQLSTLINEVNDDFPKEIFDKLLAKIYKRSK